MYFLLAGVVEKFRYLRIGLAIVLTFIGLKMLRRGRRLPHSDLDFTGVCGRGAGWARWCASLIVRPASRHRRFRSTSRPISTALGEELNETPTRNDERQDVRGSRCTGISKIRD